MTVTPPPRRSTPSRRAPARARRGGAARAVLIGLGVGVAVLVAGGLVFTLVEDDSSEPDASAATESSSPETWRLGYEGFGPIKLGMTLGEASRASGQLVTENRGCETALIDGYADAFGFTLADGRIETVSAWGTGLQTISGARPGMTEAEVLRIYPGARPVTGDDTVRALRITGSGGRVVDFHLPPEGGTIGSIVVARDAGYLEWRSPCD